MIIFVVTRIVLARDYSNIKDAQDSQLEKWASTISVDSQMTLANKDPAAQEEHGLPEPEDPGRGQAVTGLTTEWGVIEGLFGAAGAFKIYFLILFRILGISLIAAYVLGSAYADWMIGVAAGNLEGVPHERVLGGLYFAAKHLTMLIF